MMYKYFLILIQIMNRLLINKTWSLILEINYRTYMHKILNLLFKKFKNPRMKKTLFLLSEQILLIHKILGRHLNFRITNNPLMRKITSLLFHLIKNTEKWKKNQNNLYPQHKLYNLNAQKDWNRSRRNEKKLKIQMSLLNQENQSIRNRICISKK